MENDRVYLIYDMMHGHGYDMVGIAAGSSIYNIVKTVLSVPIPDNKYIIHHYKVLSYPLNTYIELSPSDCNLAEEFPGPAFYMIQFNNDAEVLTNISESLENELFEYQQMGLYEGLIKQLNSAVSKGKMFNSDKPVVFNGIRIHGIEKFDELFYGNL